MPEVAYVNGEFGPIADAKVSIEDRGFQFGDAVYEVVVAYDGRPFMLDDHLRRLRTSLEAIGMNLDVDALGIDSIIAEGIKRGGFNDTMVYLQISRGAAPRAHAAPTGLTPTIVMTFKELPSISDDVRGRGISVMTTPDTRWTRCYVKAVTLLPNVLAKTEAVRRGYDDAVFVTADGEVREGTSSNIFIVKAGALVMPPRTEAVLHGITQAFLLECAAGIGLGVDERPLSMEALREADEVFLSNTMCEVLGVTRIDDRPVADGEVGPVTKRLHAEFRKRARPPAAEVV